MPPALDPSAIAAPRLKEALAYWRSKLAGRPMPSRRDIDPLDIPQLLPHVMLVDVLAEPLDFRYRLIGTVVREISQANYTGKRYSEVPGKGPGSVVWTNCAEVVRTKAPLSPRRLTSALISTCCAARRPYCPCRRPAET